jgi:plastocyanin
MPRTLFLALIGVMVMMGLLAALSCSSSPATTPKTGTQTSPPPGGTTGPDYKPGTVTIKDFAYSPDTITVAIGTTVTWTNEDSVNHTVTSQTGLFDSGPLSNGKTFSFTFNTAGDYEYHCTIHPSMVGHVIVVQ